MDMLIRSTAMAITSLCAASAFAQDSPAPGAYVTEGGWGQLEVVRHPDKTLAFTLSSVGANGHVCGLEGAIKNGKSVEGTEDGNVCEVAFLSGTGGVEVKGSSGCRGFCGSRAWFSGEYLAVAPECAPQAIGKSRAAFLDLYQRKSYARARTLLEPILSRCEETLSELQESAPIRNDLAITYYKMGDFAACADILSPYAEDAAEEPGENENDYVYSRYDYAMYERETYKKIIENARFNLALCKKGAGRK